MLGAITINTIKFITFSYSGVLKNIRIRKCGRKLILDLLQKIYTKFDKVSKNQSNKVTKSKAQRVAEDKLARRMPGVLGSRPCRAQPEPAGMTYHVEDIRVAARDGNWFHSNE